MADLNGLIQQLPGIGALWAGQNQALSQQKQGLDNNQLQVQIQELQQKMQQDQAMNPLRQQQLSLQNQGLEAGLPGIQATSSSLQSKAKSDAATWESDAEHKRLKNLFENDKDAAERTDRVGKRMIALGPLLENVPSALRAAFVTEQMGKDMNPQMTQLLTQVKPDDLPKVLMQAGQKAAELTEPYLQATSVAKTNRDSAEKIAAGNNATSIQVARIQAEAKKTAASGKGKTIEMLIAASKTATEKAEKLEAAAAATEDEELKQQYLIRAREARQRAAEDAANRGLATPRVDAAATTNGRVQNTPAPSATAPIGGQVPADVSSAAPAVDIASKVRASGQPYEPAKYEYRINPETGKVQRKAK